MPYFEKLKEFLILILTFGVIYWFQYVDDKKRCKRREGIYDNIKLPLLATAIVGLVLFWEKNSILAVFISQECEVVKAPKVPEVNIPGIPAIPGIPKTNSFILSPSKNNLDVYTDLPEW
jgi:preprotein translocase subunit YajC